MILGGFVDEFKPVPARGSMALAQRRAAMAPAAMMQ